MSVTDKVWGALTSMIKLEDQVSRQAEAMKAQQARIEGRSGTRWWAWLEAKGKTPFSCHVLPIAAGAASAGRGSG
jgi:hypothetical protein